MPRPRDNRERTTRTEVAVRHDVEVSDVSGVAGVAVEQLTVDDESAADARRHDHREIRTLLARRTEGALGECEGAAPSLVAANTSRNRVRHEVDVEVGSRAALREC